MDDERVTWFGTGIADREAARHYLRNKFKQTPLEASAVRPGARFYGMVRKGPGSGFLLGPYSSHIMALQNVERGRRLAKETSAQADVYAYGTASLSRSELTVFGR